MTDQGIKSRVKNRGFPPDSFLEQLIAWGRSASDDIFVRNDVHDIYSSVFGALGPWRDNLHRRAVMLEVLRVLAGFESSWDWEEGVDTTNPTSITAETIEAGAWQNSANSMNIDPELKALIKARVGSTDGNAFQAAMKSNHPLAMEYTARLLRCTVDHHGPVKHHHIDAWLRKQAVEEFSELLGSSSSPMLSAAPAPINYKEEIPRPARQGINQGLTSPSSSFMTSLLGLPRDTFTGKCQSVNNPAYKKLVETRKVGPIRVTGLIVALNALERVFEDVRNELPDLYNLIGTEGMLCCRYKKIRGSVVKDPSNHSWGTAVDLKVGGALDEQGDNLVQRGLLVLSRYFNAHGWYWGAAFPTEDAMHFEVSKEQLIKWRDAGMI